MKVRKKKDLPIVEQKNTLFALFQKKKQRKNRTVKKKIELIKLQLTVHNFPKQFKQKYAVISKNLCVLK